jgi:UDP-GlcNAc:undecaprenyl-phosphate GlcNAc-1-phosphate transferase
MGVLVAGAVAFVASLVLTPVAAALARRAGVLDVPGGRKAHTKATPLLGGVAIMAAVVAGVFAGGAAGTFGVILAASGAVFLVGLADDCWKAPVWVRLAVELIAASVVVLSGTRATFLVGYAWITIPVTVIWIAGIANAFNFLDNMDGLSAGVAAIAAIMFVIVCMGTSQAVEAAALASVAGAALGFLPYNFKPARIFMGDSGSLTLGFLIGSLSIAMTFYFEGAEKTVLPLAAPLLVLALPVFDMASVLLIRLRQRRGLMKADRSHFSHRLVNLGMGERTAVLTIYLASTAIGIGAVLLKYLEWWGGALLLAQALLIFSIVVLMERAGMRRGRESEASHG